MKYRFTVETDYFPYAYWIQGFLNRLPEDNESVRLTKNLTVTFWQGTDEDERIEQTRRYSV